MPLQFEVNVFEPGFEEGVKEFPFALFLGEYLLFLECFFEAVDVGR